MMKRSEGGIRLGTTAQSRDYLVSIITVVFRAKAELLPIIENVLRLKDDSTEFVIIDGGSADGTAELLREHDSSIDYWLSEPDQGIYDAMNKGIAAARGKFLLHLNVGDTLIGLPKAELNSLPDSIDIAAFRVSVDGKEFRPASGLSLRLKNTLHHQGTFFRRESFLQYNIHYRVFADFDVNQRMAKNNARIKLFDKLVATHAGGGASDVPTSETIAEFFQIIHKNYGSAYLLPAWLICKYRGLMSRLDTHFAKV